AASHCAHGKFVRHTHFLDWRPYHYFTGFSEHRPFWHGVSSRVTYEFTPVDGDATRVGVHIQFASKLGPVRWLVKVMGEKSVKEAFEKEFLKLAEVLSQVRAQAAAAETQDGAAVAS